MTIWLLIGIAIAAGTLVLAALLLPLITHAVHLHEKRRIREHQRRRRGYVRTFPVFDDDSDPRELIR